MANINPPKVEKPAIKGESQKRLLRFLLNTFAARGGRIRHPNVNRTPEILTEIPMEVPKISARIMFQRLLFKPQTWAISGSKRNKQSGFFSSVMNRKELAVINNKVKVSAGVAPMTVDEKRR